ncbi:unnamed protein product [Adineta steineri]|uniref:C2H2-type domain-containing protein n=2 Tax=Adineta steineri TaxID=433720 RepID=A0A815AHC4_9BILA|nr:unnamed protein product [Adineta steineri]CAF1388307.1 unnamed protein product [Adineta steineri]
MPIQHVIKCAQCGMVFPNDDALVKHKTRFCVGVKDSGIGRKVYYSDDDFNTGHARKPYQSDRPTSRKGVKYSQSLDKKRDDIHEWKTKRSMLQNIKDQEDRAYYESHTPRKHKNNTKRHNDDYDLISEEYQRLEAQERDILRQMANLQTQPESQLYQSNGLSNSERNQLEALKRENARLEQERRRNLGFNLNSLSDNDPLTTIPNYEPHKLLRDMKEQRDRSQRNLQYLDDRRAYSTELPSLPYLHATKRRTSGDDLRNARNKYLQSGGHNAAVLISYSDMENRLTQYQPYSGIKDNPEPLRRQKFHAIPPFPGIDSSNTKVTTLKSENQRLQNELDDIRRRFHGLDSRTKKLETGLPTNRGPEPVPYVNGYQPMNSLIHSSVRQTDHIARQDKPYLIGNDTLTTPPYDPIDGFVIFFDFIANLPQTFDRVRLITSLHHEQTGLGEPSQLDSCRCELSADDISNTTMRTAYIATKQPVPRCPAQQALKLVIEVQSTLIATPNESFHTASWAKMPIFDYKNRLLVGRWKTPLKSLPIQHDERLSIINTYSNFGNAELYYRLVNVRDAADYSNSALIPKSRELYNYPPNE